MPDDAQALVGPGRPERVRRAGAPELGRRTGPVPALALEDLDVVDPLTGPERNLAKRARERPVEEVPEPLLDEQRAVRLDLDRDVGPGEEEVAGACDRRRGQEREDERQRRKRDARQTPRRWRQKATSTGSRAAPSTSKYGRSRNPKILANRFVGTVWIAFR